MYKKIIIFYLLLLIPVAIFSQSKEVIYEDGPYIFYSPDGSVRVISVIKSDSQHKRLLDTVYSNIKALGDIKVTDNHGKWVFPIKNSLICSLENVKEKLNIIEKGDKAVKGKIFVISDSHGNFKNFISILQKGGVINENLEWTYGKNRLMILGDTFDRGNDVLAIFWLIYSLEEQASAVGGSLSYILGNHDNMVLKGDLRYIKSKYRKLQDTIKIPYNKFFSLQSHLGRWLRSKNTIEIIGNTLFVHAGISPAFAASGISIKETNTLIGQYLDAPKSVYKDALDIRDTLGRVKFLLETNGPLWYRGLVSNKEEYDPIRYDDLTRILKQYNISRIVVGHTTFQGVKIHHKGKVISVDSADEERDIDHLAQGVEIVGNRVRIIGN